eukprot:GFYU01016445.1.p1 GENE.GFYU01016445.1~~GFYU01016445.1.p1  ORF type:complete len:181 (-),score=35.85 GFYU01016445.1:101-604(-)
MYFENRYERKKEYTKAYVLFTLCSIYTAVSLLVWALLRGYDTAEDTYGTVMGYLSAIFVIIQYFPQIATTYYIKHPGSYSVITLAIQLPGSALWCYSLTTGGGVDFTTWFPMIVTITMQLVLLVLCCYYLHLHRNMSKDTLEALLHPDEEDEEEGKVVDDNAVEYYR